MKNLFNACIVVILAFFVCLMLVSCDKKDASLEIKKTNHLNIDGVNYDLSVGGIENYGVWENKIGDIEHEGSILGLVLVSKGIKLTREKQYDDSYTEYIFDGSGQCIYVYITSSRSTGLDNGIYNCVPESAEYLGLKSFLGDYCINWKNNDSDKNLRVGFDSGDIYVDKLNDMYEIIINSVDAEGRLVTGYFKGKLDYFNHVNE